MSARPCHRASWLACAAVALAGLAHADPAPIAPITIEYVAPASCPDEISLRAGVIARLGRDPFRGDAPRRALIDVAQTAAGFVAAIELHEPGQPVNRRAVGPAAKCEDVVDALELALAVIIDPTSSSAAPPVAAPQPDRTPYQPPPNTYEPPGWKDAAKADSEPKPPQRYELAFSAGSLSGATPSSVGTVGLRAGYMVDEAWRVGVFARISPVHDRDLDSTRTYSVTNSELLVEGCMREWLVLGCAVVGFGSKSVSVDHDEGMFVVTRVAGYSAQSLLAGANLSFDVPLGPHAFLRLSVDALVPIPPVKIESEGVVRYTPPIGELGFDLALGYRW